MYDKQFLVMAALYMLGFAALLVVNVCLLIWVVNYTRRQRVRGRPDDVVVDLQFADEVGPDEFQPIDYQPGVVVLVIPPVEEDPKPNFGNRLTVRRSIDRARALMDESEKVWNDNEDMFEAERLAKLALAEVDKNAKRDHWYAPRILNWLAWLQLEKGMTAYPEAVEYWERATQIATEWYEQCSDLLPYMQECMDWVERQYPRGSSCED